MTVRTGLEVLIDQGFATLAGRRVGLMTNPSGVNRYLESTFDIFWRAPQVQLAALFSPEHGFSAFAPDAAKIGSSFDKSTGLPIHSLYGETYTPTADMLADIDVIVCDIQDLGVRYYTYAWTVTHILEAAGKQGVEVVILDRPNPLGGIVVAGPSVGERFASFVGRFPVPICHGLTLGELASLVNHHWNPTRAELSVLACDGWKRTMKWGDTRLPWVPTSPAVPHYVTVQQYPGACLIEGTNLSEGRGTALPFEIVGAPWIDAGSLARRMNDQMWEGVRFRPHTFSPTSSKWSGETCHGVHIHIMDAANWKPLEVWLAVIREIRLMYPERFAWLSPNSPGVEAGDIHHFDRLIGSDEVRRQIDSGESLSRITAGWDVFCREFQRECQPFLLYA